MTRIVHCDDALLWLSQEPILEGSSLVASMPDISEFPHFSLQEWKHWFTQTAELILSKTPSDGVTIFYQSDIKYEGAWVDKAYLCQKAAEAQGSELLWHKIACRAPAGVATFGRPSYSHILCFSKTLRAQIPSSTADVLPDLGEKAWQRGMGLKASLLIGEFIKSQTSSHTLINPFCGLGSMVAAAEFCGLHGVGIERSPKRAEKARHLRVSEDGKNWIISSAASPRDA